MIPQTFGPLAVLGGGTMAESILRGGLAAGVLDASTLIVCDPSSDRRDLFQAMGIRVTSEHRVALAGAWPILLAVKPQSFGGLAEQLRPHLAARPTLAISILAGTAAAAIQMALGDQVRVVRVMPNTAAAVRLATSAISAGPGAVDADLARAELLFAAIGTASRIEESMMNAATAIVGSGPAYLYYLAQAMIDGAQAVGFDHTTADRLVRSTILGAASLLSSSPAASPDSLRAGVTSKGGTTAAAIDVLDEAGLLDTVCRAIVAARDRGEQLAQIDTTPRG